jgi:hypothetical protein
LTAFEAAKEQKGNLTANVLATTQCPGWSLQWGLSLLPTSCSHIYAGFYARASMCHEMNMIAVKGGQACDEEIAFIEIILPKIGFESIKHKLRIADGPTFFLELGAMSWTRNQAVFCFANSVFRRRQDSACH